MRIVKMGQCKMIDINLRKTENNENDRNALIEVERKSTPNLQYVPHVFDMFASDPRGEFCIAEVDGEVVGCAKFTVTPNETAWVETLRVVPERQGLGIGKRLYERFFEIAQEENISTMRMYTGINNAVSKGLAEHFGFKLESTFLGASRKVDLSADAHVIERGESSFELVSDPEKAAKIMMAGNDLWNDFLVMNRTFYRLTPSLCIDLAQKGLVFEDAESGSGVVLGARFMPQQALHIGQFWGDHEACIRFALGRAVTSGIPSVSCLYPDLSSRITDVLGTHQFDPNASKFIVMRVDI
ncbi:MAG: GNAT family N-acetyltransferase [Anaerolineae bacterium]